MKLRKCIILVPSDGVAEAGVDDDCDESNRWLTLSTVDGIREALDILLSQESAKDIEIHIGVCDNTEISITLRSVSVDIEELLRLYRHISS
jgi:hypothetical protein